jgi:predicted XRE-type DNA-binding protein
MATRTPSLDYVYGRVARAELNHSAAKRVLAARLNVLLDERLISQTAAGQILGMPQPKVSAIRNYKLNGISLERLLQALADLGQHVDIVVRPSSPAVPAGISVAA